MPPKKQQLDDKIVRLFLKSVGAETGLYNPSTRVFAKDVEIQPLYQSNLEIVRDVLKSNRFSSRELEDLILDRYRAGERAALLSAILPKQSKKQEETDNLLEDGVTYAHPHLYARVAPSFSVSAEGLLGSTPGRIERKSEFTLKELLEYYYRKTGTAQVPSRRGRDVGALRYLLDGCRVDELLHAIDFAAAAGRVVSVFKLEDYLEDAREEVRDREAHRKPKGVAR